MSFEITNIVPSEYGWPIAMHCAVCKKTVIVHNPWACKPGRGDYFMMEMCADEPHHNLKMHMPYSPVPERLMR